MDYRETREFYNLKNATLTCFVSSYRRASLRVKDVLAKEGSVPFLKTNKQKVRKKNSICVTMQTATSISQSLQTESYV